MKPVEKVLRSAIVFLLLAVPAGGASAGEASILFVDCERQGPAWRIAVTLRHADDGWEHYADQWRLVSEAGQVLATKVLQHPHVDEQPFTRHLTDVQIPPIERKFYVEAHDTVHGWSKDRVLVDLNKTKGERYRVQ